MAALALVVSLGGKYSLRKAFEMASQVVNELGSSFCSQSLTLSFNENEKSHHLIASAEIPLSWIVSHLARKLQR